MITFTGLIVGFFLIGLVLWVIRLRFFASDAVLRSWTFGRLGLLVLGLMIPGVQTAFIVYAAASIIVEGCCWIWARVPKSDKTAYDLFRGR